MDADVGELLDEVPVVYQPAAGGLYNLVGMFDETYEEQGVAQSFLDNQGPSVMLRGTEVEKLPIDPQDDDPTLVIEGASYQVRKRVNDGPTGRGIRLHLHKVSA